MVNELMMLLTKLSSADHWEQLLWPLQMDDELEIRNTTLARANEHIVATAQIDTAANVEP